jgi:hypothetical protein
MWRPVVSYLFTDNSENISVYVFNFKHKPTKQAVEGNVFFRNVDNL